MQTLAGQQAARARRDSPLARLAALGLDADIVTAEPGLVAGGVGIRLAVRELLAAPERLAGELRRIGALLTLGIPVGLSLVDLGMRGQRRLECLLRRLQQVTRAPCIDRRLLSIAVAGRWPGLPACLQASRAWLGDGPRYALIDDVAAAAGLLRLLATQRGRCRGLEPVLASAVRSACPLLADEQGSVPVTRRGLVAPPRSAWLPLTLNLARQADAAGRIDRDRLAERLVRALPLADALFDELYWADPAQRLDAHNNRRVVVVLDGLGDLLVRRGADPAAIATLRELDGLLSAIRSCLWECSRQLARERGCLPALTRRDPGAGLADDGQRRAWQSRWREALARVALRHRNLLAIPPAALLPSVAQARPAWLDLLPLLAHADVVAAGGACRDWSPAAAGAWQQRALAVLGRRNATVLVAGGV